MNLKREKLFLFRSEEKAKSELFGTASPLIPDSRMKLLKIAALISYIIMLFMQIRNVIVFRGAPTSDAIRYVTDGLKHAADGTWYPTAESFTDLGGVAGNGFVNFLALLLRITDDLRIIYVAQIFLVQIILFSTVYIAKKISGSNSAQYVTCILFCLFGTYWSEICIARTEIFFTALSMLALALAVKGGKLAVIISGLILAYAQWTRPLATAFIVAIIWLFICRGDKLRVPVKFIAGFCAGVIALTAFTYFNSGEAVFQPTIADGNFLMGANEDADGSYNNTVFAPGKAGYLSPEEKAQMSYEEINEFYRKTATDWIKENPGKYISLLPKKLFYFLATETYSGDTYFDNRILTGGKGYIMSLIGIICGSGEREIMFGDIMVIYTQAFYMLVLVLFLAGVFYSMKKGYWRSMSFLYGLFLIGVAASLYTVGGGRYHFPYLPVMIITAALFIDAVFVRRKKKTKKLK
ncbi:MAG: hypothetical protein IJ261_06260 [Clostridia bacterium]|nr:hypothetical protein [Clostridia bacterium]